METAENFISTFDRLPAREQHKVATFILRRTLQSDEPPVSDEELVWNAESLFLELDRREAKDAQS